jgi:Transglutaminase-like superfamily
MPLNRLLALYIFMLALLIPVNGGAADPLLLTTPPLGEQWFSITMGNERTGFTRTAISAVPGGYEVASDSSARMVVLGFSRNAWSRETYLINRDLSMKSFHVNESIDGKAMTLSGEVTAQGVNISVTEGGKRREKTLKLRGKVYPGPLLNIYPLMQGGLAKGKSFRPRTLDIEEVKVKEVTITVVGRETLAGGTSALHLRNNIYPMVDNDIWVDPAGTTLRESVREGLIVTAAEEGAAARRELIAAALARKEWLADFSMVETGRPLARPEELKKLVVELSGIPASMPLQEGTGQKEKRLESDRVLFTLTKSALPHPVKEKGVAIPEREKQAESDAVPDHDWKALALLGKSIVGEEKSPALKVEKLVRWIAASVADGGNDTPPMETSRLKKGDSLSRVRLYTALAKAAGVPSRTVAGLVHVKGKGFLYHVWAESFIGEWLPVDPCTGQSPADATHIKLAETDSPAEMAALAGLIGRVGAKIVEESY